jgi:hypothetical protein
MGKSSEEALHKNSGSATGYCGVNKPFHNKPRCQEIFCAKSLVRTKEGEDD